jgi:hypothetical protein
MANPKNPKKTNVINPDKEIYAAQSSPKVPLEAKFPNDAKVNIPSDAATAAIMNAVLESERQRIDGINYSLENGGFDPGFLFDGRKGDRDGLTSGGVFFLGKNYLTELLSHSDTIGIWIWLIKVGDETQIIVSRAGRSSNPQIIPDLNLPFQIHRVDNRIGISESFEQSTDLAWKELKKNEGRFNITKGFFVGKRAILTNLGETELDEIITGALVEVFQDSDNFPYLGLYKFNSRKLITEFGRTFPDRTQPKTPIIPGIIPGMQEPKHFSTLGGGSNSRPSPPYGS